MTKLRLTNSHREKLLDLAMKLVRGSIPAELDKPLFLARSDLELMLTVVVEERYPVSDMLVLVKYGKATTDNCIRLKLTRSVEAVAKTYNRGGDYHIYNFTGRVGPIAPGCQTYLLSDAQTGVYERWVLAFNAVEMNVQYRYADYAKLINASRYYEDVLDIWPEAEALRVDFGRAAVAVVLTGDVISRIRADAEARVAA